HVSRRFAREKKKKKKKKRLPCFLLLALCAFAATAAPAAPAGGPPRPPAPRTDAAREAERSAGALAAAGEKFPGAAAAADAGEPRFDLDSLTSGGGATEGSVGPRHGQDVSRRHLKHLLTERGGAGPSDRAGAGPSDSAGGRSALQLIRDCFVAEDEAAEDAAVEDEAEEEGAGCQLDINWDSVIEACLKGLFDLIESIVTDDA
ncbi:MAG: hypothetical protein BJ554DRAFT_3123, partial [Olpidium bornovanus]